MKKKIGDNNHGVFSEKYEKTTQCQTTKKPYYLLCFFTIYSFVWWNPMIWGENRFDWQIPIENWPAQPNVLKMLNLELRRICWMKTTKKKEKSVHFKNMLLSIWMGGVFVCNYYGLWSLQISIYSAFIKLALLIKM